MQCQWLTSCRWAAEIRCTNVEITYRNACRNTKTWSCKRTHAHKYTHTCTGSSHVNLISVSLDLVVSIHINRFPLGRWQHVRMCVCVIVYILACLNTLTQKMESSCSGFPCDRFADVCVRAAGMLTNTMSGQCLSLVAKSGPELNFKSCQHLNRFFLIEPCFLDSLFC